MKSIAIEFLKTSEKLPDKKSHLMLELKDQIQSGWFHGSVFETDSEYIYEINEVEHWAYMPKSFERKRGRVMEKPIILNEFAKGVHQNAVDHGWWEEEKTFGEIIALCHSELSEALEEYRNKKPNVYFTGYDMCDRKIEREEPFDGAYGVCKPEGIAIELADCIIRILDYCGRNSIDIEYALNLKHEYNKDRSYRHGGKML